MALKFSLKKVGKRLKSNQETLHYAIAKSDGVVNENDIAKRIEAMSGLSSIDIVATLEAFSRIICDELADGKKVKLSKLGIFYLSLQSKGVEKIDDFKRDNIKKIKINFLPDILLKRKIVKIPLELELENKKKYY